jgi:SH3 domain-containing YSC84-like protein 1
MKRGFAVLMLSLYSGFALLATAPKLEAQSNAKEEDRLYNSALVVKEAMGMSSRIPQKVLDNAKCVIVIPSVIKGAVGFGGSYGRGAMSCRGGEDFNGPWTYPTMMALEGFSAGLQLGGQATDFVLMVMDERGASAILSGKFKIGGDAAASAGPIGRDSQANLDIYMRTTILSYSRSRGLFAGVSLEGSTLRPDNRANEKLYGKKLNARNIVLENAVPTPPPAPAEKLVATLDKYGKSAAGTSAAAVAAPTAPAAPGSSPAPAVESKLAKQEDIQKMAQQTLQQLYQVQPLAKGAIEKAAGYAVFSDMGFKILLAGSGTGQGVVVNNQTNQKTYMKMVELQAGLGFGISKFRNVFVFRTKDAMESFINSGWQFGGQATAGAKTADSGGAMQGAVSVANAL